MTPPIRLTPPLGNTLLSAADPRARAFCTPGGPEVFHAVAHRHEIWRPDPFDVESIHAEARVTFQGLVGRASMTPKPMSGRILLLTGESGSGKTHLMRAFRNWVHGGQRGYCGYMQMTSAADHYGRYVLNNLIDSLSQPYYEPFGDMTGLSRLSTALAESCSGVSIDRLASLREDELDAGCLAKMINALAGQIAHDERFDFCDTDLIVALLYLQRDDPYIRSRVLKYLRCERLSKADEDALGGLESSPDGAAPDRVLEKLGKLMEAVEGVPLIVCLDQLEDIFDMENAPARFRRAMSAVTTLADSVPSSVVVISCLEDFYDKLGESVTKSAKARIEGDPKPIRLSARRDVDEVRQLIARRLEALYEPHGVAIAEDAPTYPIPAAKLPGLAALPTRLILDWCREFREKCIAGGEVVKEPETTAVAGKPADPPANAYRLEQLWNDFRSGPGTATPTDEPGLAAMLARSIAACGEEMAHGRWFSAEAERRMVAVECHDGGDAGDRLLVAVCDKSAKGGGLGKQIGEVEKRASDQTPEVTPVIVRSSGFPTSPNAAVSKQIGELIRRGGRRAQVDDADWRAMSAMRSFREKYQGDPDFAGWLAAEKPLSRLKSLRTILDLDALKSPIAEPPAAPPAPTAKELQAPTNGRHFEERPIVVGTALGIRAEPVTIDAQDLVRHSAFLGGTGSGKTTLALAIIEHLLQQGVPAILVDRKGDLCRYADPSAWSGVVADPALEARRATLRERVDVAVYTPGDPEGRPLSIAAIPHGLGALPSHERGQSARYAANALGGMMNYKATGSDATRLVILANAMDVLSQARTTGTATLGELIGLIHDEDPALVNAIGKLETSHFRRLVNDLETLRLSRGELLAAKGEPLDAEALFGLGAYARPGKTRLTVLSTKALGANQDIQFWVAQLLMELARWTSRSPSKGLQAVVMFDEADLYLPADRKPPTKEPMENLLRRARSGGLGVMLASQSPGDFDYKCRDNIRSWFVGKVKEKTALAKMKPMLNDCPFDAAAKLPNQTTGQFHWLREGSVTAFMARRSLVTAEQVPEGEIAGLALGTMNIRRD